MQNLEVLQAIKACGEDELLSALNAPESLKENEKNFDDPKPKTKFSKSRIEEIRKNFNELRQNFLNHK